MPLVVSGLILDELPLDTHTFLQSNPHFKEISAALRGQPPKVVGPIGLLYVGQREYAVTLPHDKSISILGVDDATTCVMAVLRHQGSGAAAVAHFDGSSMEEGVMNMVRKLQEISIGYPTARLELHLVGGFQDSRGYSEELAITLLHLFHKQPVEIEVITCSICELNSTIRGGINWPVIYGIGVNIKTGEIFPATFPDKGPELPLRSARHFAGSHQTAQLQMLDIYDCGLGLMRIGPFNYEPLRGVDLWLQQNDEFILQHLSTSPEVEPPHFVMNVRATLKHIQEHPFPSVTIFPDNRPLYYRKDESGAWIQVRY